MKNDRFYTLLNLYLNNAATVEEQEELMSMISHGGNDEAIRRAIDAMMANEPVTEPMDADASKKILEKIIGEDVAMAASVSSRPVAKWRWYAAAAVFLVAMSAGWWLKQNVQPSVESVAIKTEKQDNVVFNGNQYVRLPDGSTALLNDGSRLSYKPTFGKMNREVTLSGEAYFDVSHDSQNAFRVVTGKITTTVLGTTFNIKAYPDQREVEVTVTRGKVQVNSNNQMLGVITPDQQISVNTVTNDFVQRNVKAETASAWQLEYLILDDLSLAEAAKTIGKKYNVQIALQNDRLKSCRISATFLKGESLEQVLTVVTGVVQAKYVIEADGNVIIDGHGCL